MSTSDSLHTTRQWRTDAGKRNLYVLLSNHIDHQADNDPWLGVCDTSEIARAILMSHNYVVNLYGRHYLRSLTPPEIEVPIIPTAILDTPDEESMLTPERRAELVSILQDVATALDRNELHGLLQRVDISGSVLREAAAEFARLDQEVRGVSVKRALTPLDLLWRVGINRESNAKVYALRSNNLARPSKHDPLCGVFKFADVAEDVVLTHNALVTEHGRHYLQIAEAALR